MQKKKFNPLMNKELNRLKKVHIFNKSRLEGVYYFSDIQKGHFLMKKISQGGGGSRCQY